MIGTDGRDRCPPLCPDLDQGGVEIDVVRHDDRAHDAHGLQQLLPPAAAAVGEEYALQHLRLDRPYHHVLGTEEGRAG